jgi:hypothetical protein
MVVGPSHLPSPRMGNVELFFIDFIFLRDTASFEAFAILDMALKLKGKFYLLSF